MMDEQIKKLKVEIEQAKTSGYVFLKISLENELIQLIAKKMKIISKK